jgi:hypothetical protein
MGSALVFVAVAAIMCVAAILATLGSASVQMSRAEVIERDGLLPGARAPSWTLVDSSGNIHLSPPEKPLQLVMFTDHSLIAFPSVAEGLQKLAAHSDELEIVVLLRRANDVVSSTLRLLDLAELPILVGSPTLYGKYNVRVTPFAIFVDNAGRVRASSLVNHDWQLVKLYQIAALPLPPIEPRPTKIFRWRSSRAAV